MRQKFLRMWIPKIGGKSTGTVIMKTERMGNPEIDPFENEHDLF
jgi:hypothetical protein